MKLVWKKDADCYRGEPSSRERQAVCRLVVCSVINSRDEVDYYLMEFYIDQALDAGTDVEQIDSVFARHVPGFMSRDVQGQIPTAASDNA